ncbi:enoyl-CoA hydratase-related protein [Methylocystis sp. IM4]
MGPGIAPSWKGKNWLLKRDADDVAWLILDRAGESVNTLSEAVLSELDECLGQLEARPAKGLVLRSGKRSGFIAGADIADLRGMRDAKKIKVRLNRAAAVVNRLDALAFPTVAVIHGFCLGGGLELALACDYRLALRGASFVFPEIKLGLHPGLGGTARLTRLIDPLEAMTMMLTGRSISPPRRKRSGSLISSPRSVTSWRPRGRRSPAKSNGRAED